MTTSSFGTVYYLCRFRSSSYAVQNRELLDIGMSNGWIVSCKDRTGCERVAGLSYRFRPIRRDSDSAESQSSASLAGSAADGDVPVQHIPARLPPRSAAVPTATRGAATAAARRRRPKPTWSSNGSASSYDNLEERSTPPRHARLQPWLPHNRASRRVHPAATTVGSGTEEALDEPAQPLTSGDPSNLEVVNTSNTGVWRRPTLDGHIQVVPPTMIGVFDPSSQLSKFARQASDRRTSPVANVQRQSVTADKVSETVSNKLIHFDSVRQTDKIHDTGTANAVNISRSPHRTPASTSQSLEPNKTADFKSDEPSKLDETKSPKVCEATQEVIETWGGDPGRDLASSSSSSSSSTDNNDDDNNAELVKVDDEDAAVSADVLSRTAEPERQQLQTTTPSSDSHSSYEREPAVVDVTVRKSDEKQAATPDELSVTTSSTTPSRDDAAADDRVADSPVAASAISPPVNHDSSDDELEQPPDVDNEALPSRSSSTQSESSSSSHDEQYGNVVEQNELRISATDQGIFYYRAHIDDLVGRFKLAMASQYNLAHFIFVIELHCFHGHKFIYFFFVHFLVMF